MMQKFPVGFIGLGLMGAPMAAHILRAGFPMHVYNRTATKTAPLAKLGATVHATPRQVAAQAQVVICMVHDAPDVAAVTCGPDGVFAGAQPGCVVINMGTVSPDSDRALAAKAQQQGLGYMDIPVSGGDVGAQAGTLSMMAGGDPEHLQMVLPVLQCMGKRITHCGPVGAGQATKLCNQMMVAANIAGLCEAWNFARAQGLDLATTLEALSGGAAASWQLTQLAPRIAAGDDAPGFKVKALLKDLQAVESSAARHAMVLQVTPVVKGLLEQAMAAGYGEAGTQVVWRMLQGRA